MRAPNAGSPRIVVAFDPDRRHPAAVLEAVKDKPAAALESAVLDRPCARRHHQFAVGTEECSQRGSNKRMGLRRKMP